MVGFSTYPLNDESVMGGLSAREIPMMSKSNELRNLQDPLLNKNGLGGIEEEVDRVIQIEWIGFHSATRARITKE